MSKPELIQWSKVKILSMGADTNQENISSDKILHCFEESDETILLAPYPNSFEKAEQFCADLNGFMPLPRNPSHLNEIFANRDFSNNTSHSIKGRGRQSVSLTFFDSLNLDFNAFGSKRSCFRSRLRL